MNMNDKIMGRLPKELTNVIIKDKQQFGLKKCEISSVQVRDLQLDVELKNYNAEISDEVTVIKGKDKEKNDVTLYYYFHNILDSIGFTRQARFFNSHGDIERMDRNTMFEDGRYVHIDDAIVSYSYDRHGNKKAALYQDDLEGMQYLEYDKTGNLVLRIGRDYIMQKAQEGEESCWICEGNIKPEYNGFTLKKHVPMESLTPDDMQRAVTGEDSHLITKILMFEPERREEVLNILREVEPVFESCQASNVMSAQRKMQKMVQWFPGFAKRLRINSILGIQDCAVMRAMRTAVGKTIGNTRSAERDLKTPEKQEIKEKEIGDN